MIKDKGNRVTGGVALLTSHSIPSTMIHLNTHLQAVAVRINIHTLTTICNVYLPPDATVDKKSLNELVDQLPPPFILIGDFNGHSTLWGNRDVNPRGRRVH